MHPQLHLPHVTPRVIALRLHAAVDASLDAEIEGSTPEALDGDALAGSPVRLELHADDGEVTAYHGIVASLTLTANPDAQRLATLHVRSATEFLTLRKNARIFRDQTAADIVKEVLPGGGIDEDAFVSEVGAPAAPEKRSVTLLWDGDVLGEEVDSAKLERAGSTEARIHEATNGRGRNRAARRPPRHCRPRPAGRGIELRRRSRRVVSYEHTQAHFRRRAGESRLQRGRGARHSHATLGTTMGQAESSMSAEIDAVLRGYPWLDCELHSLDGGRLTVAGGVALHRTTYITPDVLLHFEDVFLVLALRVWRTDTEKTVFSQHDGADAFRLGVPFTPDKGYHLFRFQSEDFETPYWIAARSVSMTQVRRPSDPPGNWTGGDGWWLSLK